MIQNWKSDSDKEKYKQLRLAFQFGGINTIKNGVKSALDPCC